LILACAVCIASSSLCGLSGLRCLHPFPPRRSPDLEGRGTVSPRRGARQVRKCSAGCPAPVRVGGAPAPGVQIRSSVQHHCMPVRSEEHTSELQSRENLVCRLLLEKKNNIHEKDSRE